MKWRRSALDSAALSDLKDKLVNIQATLDKVVSTQTELLFLISLASKRTLVLTLGKPVQQ